ncbi:hypothetical protein [Roseicella aquatilis]|uniref:Uncharacterized protein n=1 Tax=Roseicella aquatilis TaxID=2527868 RepID=A0A4R4D6V2_9PROT|nr:hypothetical protein [Roseicella aquatilis]TCZ55749.1 hypothetical protein EXY23_20675 [Roseicella aquatilis]
MAMKLQILSVRNHGDAAQEHVLLRAKEDCNTVKYLLADSTYFDNGNVSNKLRHFFWLPSKDVKKGDLVSVRTGKGKNTEVINPQGTTVHRFYWGLEAPVWNDEADCAVLVEASTWQFHRAKG